MTHRIAYSAVNDFALQKSCLVCNYRPKKSFALHKILFGPAVITGGSHHLSVLSLAVSMLQVGRILVLMQPRFDDAYTTTIASFSLDSLFPTIGDLV